MAAREATRGRLAHQTWSLFGAGNGVMGVRSRRLSTPISAMGSQGSMRRLDMTRLPCWLVGEIWWR